MEESKSAIAALGGITGYDSQTAVLEAAGLCGICTDEHLKVLKSFGDTTAYLKNENFVFALIDLLPGKKMSGIVRSGAHEALKTSRPVMLRELDFGTDTGNQQSVNIMISPLASGNVANRQLLILFSTNKRSGKEKLLRPAKNNRQLAQLHLNSLEQELAETKSKIQGAFGLINSSNENIQSFNEELQSANEEMHSTNEELQSVNEELQTINWQQHQANSELAETNDDLNNYFLSNTNGQLFVDRNLLLKRFSPAVLKHINLRDSDIGRSLTHITTNIKFQTIIADIRQVLLEGKAITREAESMDGKIYQVMTMPYIRQDAEKADGAIISFYDITELKKLLAALDISNRSLTASVAAIELSRETVRESLEKEKLLNVMKSRFVSMASHEFKTPLTAIQLAAGLIGKMAMELDHPIISKYTQTIKNAAKNLTDILNDFLSMELLETGSIDPIMTEFDVVRFAEDIAEDMQALTSENQQINYRHTGKGRLVTLNPSLLKNSVINLVSNAIKYSGPDSVIVFNTRITSRNFVITISDNGIGIPKEDQKHLFEAFFRAQNIGNIPGTGLGLNIVTRYTALMNGQIKFKSEVNEGTTFTLTFPVNPL